MVGEPECGVGGTRMVSTPQTSGVRRVLVPGLIFRFVQVGVSPARCELCACSPDPGSPPATCWTQVCAFFLGVRASLETPRFAQIWNLGGWRRLGHMHGHARSV